MRRLQSRSLHHLSAEGHCANLEKANVKTVSEDCPATR